MKTEPDPKTQTEQNDIENVDRFVQRALEMLMGAGGHREGFRGLTESLAGSTKVLSGVATDHWHRGYKAITMAAFQKGLQRILSDCYVALKLLELHQNKSTLSDADKQLIQQKFDDPNNRDYVLKILGIKKLERDKIAQEYPTHGSFEEKLGCIQQHLPYAGKTAQLADRQKRIELMLSGALCYVPFSEPNDGTKFQIPTKDAKGIFHLQKSTVERVNLSPGLAGPYHAIHLRPDDPKTPGQDHLLFMGTNPLPTSSGPSTTVYADTISGKSIGETFMEASEERIENMLRTRFKENLKNIIQYRLDEFTDPSGTIDYQKIWLAARVKCVGQSLGGSLSLQCLAKYPFMVEASAFEPPFLLDKYKEIIDTGLQNAHTNYSNIISEVVDTLSEDKKQSLDIDALKKAIPEDAQQCKTLIAKHNVAIAQLIDYATNYGTVSPPVTLYHVDTKRQHLPLIKKMKNKLYRGVMAGTLMSHAMVLAGQNDKVIRELDDINQLFSETSRKSFTHALDKAVWKMINGPVTGYLYLKHYYLDKIGDPKWDPSKHPNYIPAQKEMLAGDIAGKWEAVKRGIETAGTPGSWQGGDHLFRKIEELARMMARADQLGLPIEGYRREIKLFILNPPDVQTTQQALYLEYLSNRLPISKSSHVAKEPSSPFLEKAYKFCKENLKALYGLQEPPDQAEKSREFRSNIIDFYAVLGKTERRQFIADISTLSPNHQPDPLLVRQLMHYANNRTEQQALQSLLTPEKPAKSLFFRRSSTPSSHDDRPNHSTRPRKPS